MITFDIDTCSNSTKKKQIKCVNKSSSRISLLLLFIVNG